MKAAIRSRGGCPVFYEDGNGAGADEVRQENTETQEDNPVIALDEHIHDSTLIEW